MLNLQKCGLVEVVRNKGFRVTEVSEQDRMVGLADMIGTAELARSAQEHLSLVDLLEARDGRGAETLLTTRAKNPDPRCDVRRRARARGLWRRPRSIRRR